MPTTSSPTDDVTVNNIVDTLARPPHYLMWFRRDLRLHDNTALAALCEHAQAEKAASENIQVSAVFFFTPKQWHTHDDSLTQVDHIARTVPKLAQDLYKQLNITLMVFVCPQFSDCIDAIGELCERQQISCVMANHEYEGNEIDRDTQLTEQLSQSNIEFIRWHDQCILPPQTITTNDDSMYQIFTPFYKKWRHALDVSPVETHKAQAINSYDSAKTNDKLFNPMSSEASANTPKSIEMLSKKVVKDYQYLLENAQTDQPVNRIDNDAQLTHARTAYPAGEDAARHHLDQFITDDIGDYNVSRDVPILYATSQLSAYLTIGAISARHCYLQAMKALDNVTSAQANKDSNNEEKGDNEDINRWISELAWRDFYRHVLVDKPELIHHQAYKNEIDGSINWSYNNDDFMAWYAGKTGVPLVDAAMRCLNATGFMHNRLRMVTAMFLTKDLLIDWRLGERYFMQQLIDGDFASNNGGWQWSASTGTDSAPYFRIMNPFSQAKAHDPDAIFIKTWLPELKDIPTSILHSEDKLQAALAKGGKFAKINYPLPMVEHKAARQRVIAEFKKQ